uniref:Chondroitin sulfate proteoglycan 4-like n=1 Tax=Pundamilia nyererei TaxID=303518 RepID=A0A3B4FUM2_9CICH
STSHWCCQRDLSCISICGKVRLDLGSGEHSLRSEKGIHLSDLAWHTVDLTHTRHNITMTVDQNSHTGLQIQGPDLELGVEDGLLVGGTAGLNHLYLHNISSGFRGCMDEVVFNQHDLLSSLRPHSGYKTVHEVSLGCSPQFSATEEDSVSFFSSEAFMSLPPWDVLQEGVFECELHPAAKEEEDGIVLYSSDNQGGFVAIEIVRGHLVASVGGGEGSKTELHSLTNVNSNHTWYTIQLHLLPHSVQLKVGKELVKASLSPEIQVLQLTGPLFVGGLDEAARGQARRAGLISVPSGGEGGGSFKGCLSEIRVNTQKTGLPHATVTKDVTVGCRTGQAPQRASLTSPTDLPGVDITTAQTNAKRSPNFLMLRKLEVSEGGRLRLDLRIEEKDRTFSMLDLWQGRVMYVHSGSEDQSDFFTFSVFSSNKKELPVFLKGNRLHQFEISISAVNDAPVLSLPEGNYFTLLEKSRRQVGTAKCLSNYTSLGNLNTEAGYLEHQDYPGRPINLFSLNDLEEGKISFIHTGVSTSRLALRVSDGQKVSKIAAFLRIITVPLEDKLVNNTGLEVNQGEASVITTNHLAVQVNVADPTVEIWYNVTEFPQYGELQRLHSSGEWKPATSFSQKLLEKERIRYLSTYRGLQMQNNITDHFKFKVSIGSLAKQEAVFPIAVRWIHFKITRSKMELNGVQAAVLTPEDLHVISKGVKLSESDLHFRMVTVPKKGQLLLNNKALQRNSTFSQRNISDGLVRYELINRQHDDTRDTFSFQVFSAHSNSTTYDFRINIKAESTTVTMISKGLSVMEGGSKVITRDILFTHTASNREVLYNIIESPRHGHIRRINLSNSTSINDNIMAFTNQDITEERIMYVHDDSETKQDSFTFQIVVYKAHKHTNKKEDGNGEQHTFNISVQLVNDQRPVRVVDKVFHVAREGQRLVTLSDLRYRDDDSDFEDSWLVYTRRGIPMGELVLASDPSHKLYEFTQRDLEQKKVLFVHKGVSFGRFVLFVSDGKHYVSTLLEVMAQDPYLQVENNTGIMVEQGGITTLTSANLSVFSNLDIRDPHEVTFEVFIPPKHGVICFIDRESGIITDADAISIFTQRDLIAGRLVYRHDGSHKLSDSFNVTARARERSTERQVERGKREVYLDFGVSVKIYLESHQRPPTVRNNRPVVVEEGQNISISRDNLEVVHEDSQPSEIVFTVHSLPTVGVCSLSPSMQGIKKQSTPTFTQEDLNQGLVIYQQQTTGSTNDSVLLEATNGVTKVGPIRLEIDIIPILLPLQVKRSNGGQFTKPESIASHHFSGMNFLYQYISYIHDGSDTLRDNFTIVANQTETRKHSLPCAVHINITPVNDETPVITTNHGLKVWVGSVTEITTGDLSAEDTDTPPEGLEFIVTPPSNGHLALKSAPSRHILNFTQSHIESKQLVFVHNGAPSGGFHFQVNDGLNFAPRQIFSTTAHSLILTLITFFVYPEGSVTPISDKELQAVTNIADGNIRRNQSVVFAVTSPPKLGRLVRRMPDNSTRNVSTFTQSMLDDGVILYDQNKPESVGWSAADTFSFTASLPPASLPPHTFTILISYQANEHHDSSQHKTRLINNAGAVVAEGGRVTIDRSKLDASNLLGKIPESHRKDHHIMYRVISLPRYGILSIRGHNLTRNQPDFSQVTLNKFGITYFHDDSETTSDSFTFRAWVAPLDLPSSSSSSSLSAFSSDSSSSSSSFSSLYSASSSPFSSLDTVSHHHVKDTTGVTEMFNITVTPVNDQPPLIRSRLFSLEVIKPSVSIVNNTGLSLIQGRTAVVLTTNQLAAQTNGQSRATVSYTVTTPPRHGRIAINDQEVTTFRHEDLQFGRVVYHMTDLSESEDTFQMSVSASSPGINYGNVTATVKVTVRPLIYLREPVRVPSGIAVKLGKAMIDASELARISRANPVFEVLSPPKHGKLVKVKPFVVMSRASEVLKSFTFRDVVQGRVAIEENLSDSDNQLHNNESTLTTAQVHAPPAKGELHFTILPHHQMRHGPGGFNKIDKIGREHTTARLPAHNRTTAGRAGREGGRGGSTAHGEVTVGLHPHILSHKHHNRTHHKLRPHNRLGNHTRNGSPGGRSKSSVEGAGGGHSHAPQPHTPSIPEKHGPGNPPDTQLIHVEVLPRPASDPLLIILPLLACLLLIIILIVLILVFRHRKEKQARLRLVQALAAVPVPNEDSPYLGRPERSVAMPSVMVTPLGSASCPTSPRVPTSPRRSLAPGMTFWGPFEADLAGGDRNIRGCNSNERDNKTSSNPLPRTTGFRTSVRSRSPTPTLKEGQYWV